MSCCCCYVMLCWQYEENVNNWNKKLFLINCIFNYYMVSEVKEH